jgi:hypothetical protein
MSAMGWASILIAVAALAFTMFTFWWMQWRVGHLIVPGPPSTYAAMANSDRLILLFPFVFFNTGPVPYVVRNLRLRFADEDDGTPLAFQRIRSGISPSHHPEPVDLAAAFPVPGNSTVRLFCEFSRKPAGRVITAGTHPLVLEALTDKRVGWERLLLFDLVVEQKAAEAMANSFIAFENGIP